LEDATWRRGFCGFDTFSKVARSVLFALDLKMTFLHWEKATAADGDFFVLELGGAIFAPLLFASQSTTRRILV